jgi:2-furoyl-CoA dehydrogenase 2Fe-2S iron sulfur subunit
MRRLKSDARHPVTLEVNGQPRIGQAETRGLLSDFLRHELGLYGTHVDGRAVRSCTQFAVECDGAAVRTVEGLVGQDELGILQQAFRRHHAVQCGFCTAGILMSATDFLGRHPDPSEVEVRDMLSGHICRCTGYYPIVLAILDAARAIREAGG